MFFSRALAAFNNMSRRPCSPNNVGGKMPSLCSAAIFNVSARLATPLLLGRYCTNHDGDVLDLLAGFGFDARFQDVPAVVEDFHDFLTFFIGEKTDRRVPRHHALNNKGVFRREKHVAIVVIAFAKSKRAAGTSSTSSGRICSGNVSG